MSDEPPLQVVPLSKGIRKTKADSDPFGASVGEALEAACGTFSLEGGFEQHGGLTQYTETAAGGAITWMKRWYKPDGSEYFLVLSGNGVLSLVSDVKPSTLTTLYSGLSGDPFSSAEINGWIYLSNGTDPFLRYDGTTVLAVGAEVPSITGVVATETVGGGELDAGTYRFKITVEYGTEGVLGESNASTGDVSITVAANGLVTLTDLPISARADVTYKNIYRTLKDGDIFFWVGRIENIQTTFTEGTADTVLGSSNFQLEEDHDIPPRLKHLSSFRGRLFGEDPDIPGRLRFSLVLGSDVFPDDPMYYSDELGQDGESITGLFRLGEALFAAKRSRIWVLTGDTNANFLWDETPGGFGMVAENAIAKGDGLVFGVGPRDMHVFDGVTTRPLEKVRGLLDSAATVTRSAAVGVYRNKKYYVALQTGGDTRRSLILVVHADPVPGGDRFTVSTIELDYTSGGADKKLEISSLAVWENEGDRIFVGGYDGYVYEFDVGTLWNRVGEDQAYAAYNWKSNWLWGQGPAFFDRFHKAYIMIESEGGVATFSYEIMTDDPNDLSSGTQTIDLNPTVSVATQRIARWNYSRWG